MIKEFFRWLTGEKSEVPTQGTKAEKKPRLKNEVELREHVVVMREGTMYKLYTHDFRRSAIPTEAEKRACLLYKDKMAAIAAGRQLIRKLHSTQPHPALVL